METRRIIALGDSITRGHGVEEGEGWVEILAELLKERFGEGAPAVVNAGGNGNTSAEGLARMDADVMPHLPGLVLVEFGGNDTVHDARAVSVEQFEANLRLIHDRVQGRGGKVLFLTFPPIIDDWHQFRTDAYYNRFGGLDACVEQYRQRMRDLARQLECPLFDLDHLLRRQIAEDGPQAVLLPDGVHLTPAAHRRVARALLETIW